MKAYLATVETGSYEDYSNTILGLYTSLDAAKACCERWFTANVWEGYEDRITYDWVHDQERSFLTEERGESWVMEFHQLPSTKEFWWFPDDWVPQVLVMEVQE